jgi:hypothetical protein
VSDTSDVPVGRLILVPALITLGITVLRLVGELLHWSSRLFNRDAGGLGSIVGIVWLVPVFGVWFALQLRRQGLYPRLGRAFGFPLLALLLFPAVFIPLSKLQPSLGTQVLVGAVVALAAVAVGMAGWPALGRTLLAYGLAARIPVALLMLVAILGNWGTHYDVAPPEMTAPPPPFLKWVLIGLIPQLTMWMAFTIVVGGLFGAFAVLMARRPRRVAGAGAPAAA